MSIQEVMIQIQQNYMYIYVQWLLKVSSLKENLNGLTNLHKIL
jgi:hypothetical protein